MKKYNSVVWILALTAGVAFAQTSSRRIVDLTYSFSSRTIYWPTADGFRLNVDAEGMTEKGYYYTANSFSAAEHGGTHLDAPIHFAKGMPTIDQIPLERLMAPGIVIDVQNSAARDSDYLIRVEDFSAWERSNGPIPEDCIVLLRTGWGKYYPDKKKYLGTDAKGEAAIAELHFPGLAPAAAEWLVKNRKISAIGLDTASIDRGQSQYFECHRILFKAGILVLENVANLDQLPAKGFDLIALPMKIEKGSGAPVRIVALLD